MRTDSGEAVNAHRARLFGTERERLIAFVCECGDADCHRTVLLTLDAYNQRRPALIRHDGHGDADAPLRREAS